VAVAAREYHSLAIKADGSLYAWGANSHSQLGLGTTTDYESEPTRVGSDSNWVAVAAGALHSLGLKADGSLYAWGANSHGQLGLGNYIEQQSPQQVVGFSDWVAVAAGALHSLGLKGDGSLHAWGFNSDGQLGLGDTNYRLSPTLVRIPSPLPGILFLLLGN
jgi:alpha-tubulin suppressor-like RCC1 family protein